MKLALLLNSVLLLVYVPLGTVSLSTTSSTSPSSPSLFRSGSIAQAAIRILEEQSDRNNTPVDAVLRRYFKQHRWEAQKKEALRDLLLGIARSQYRIDWRLREAGISPCKPEHRVVVALGIGRSEHEHERQQNLEQLTESYPWLQDVLASGSSSKSSLFEVDGMDLQTRLECPDWAWPGLQDAFGMNKQRLSTELRALQQPAPLDLRVNTLKCESREEALQAIIDAGFDAVPTEWSPLGIRLGRVPLGKIPGLLKGVVEPQDEGSQIVAALLDAKPGEVVADYCAGTGGKTLQIAAQMKNKGRLYTMDVDADRLERGRARCSKAGVSNVHRQTVQADMTHKDKWCKRRKRTFDRVLVDAPCSGVGSWRRKPDARRTWAGLDDDNGAERLAQLLPLQQKILQRASRLVKAGGRLVYVTCSLLPQENEHQIRDFLGSDEGADWRVDPPSNFCVPFEAGDVGQFLRLTPAQHDTDGFFAAVLTRDDAGPRTKKGEAC